MYPPAASVILRTAQAVLICRPDSLGRRTDGRGLGPSRCSGPVRHNGHTTQGCRPPPTHEPSGEPSLGGSLWNLNGPAGRRGRPPWPASPGTASTSERATTPGSTPTPRVVARTGRLGAARSPGSMADPPRGRRVGRTPATDLPKNADDAGGVTGAQTTTPAAQGPVGRGGCVDVPTQPCAGTAGIPRSRQR
jgi:hypothetical protein